MQKQLTIFLLISTFFSFPVYANEKAEIEQAIRHLESAQQALYRAQKHASNIRVKDRVYFDYAKAKQDIAIVRDGIDRYINSNRAQPRDPRQIRTLSGEYDKVRVNQK